VRLRRLPSLALVLPAVTALSLLAGCASMAPVEARTTTVEQVDAERYLGTWYEVGSVKQFFSVGLVNTTANYRLNADGSIRVENRGEYAALGNLESRIVGRAVAVDESFARLNVSFTGYPSKDSPGNYWIVALDPDYQWAVVSDPTGTSAFLLSRTPQVSEELYQRLVDLAAAAGVRTGNITRTVQTP
jgi:lipocalin